MGSRFFCLISVAIVATTMLFSGCSPSSTTGAGNDVTTVVPVSGNATLDATALNSLNDGTAITVPVTGGNTYVLKVFSMDTTLVLEADDGKGTVTYFRNTAGTVQGTWVAFEQKRDGVPYEIAPDPANQITITITSQGSLAIATVGSPAYQPDIIIPSGQAGLDATVDSLFNVLITRVQSIQNTESYDAFAALNFMSLRDGFDAAIARQADHPKANTGYMIAAILSLNTSQSVAKLADSLDAYFNAVSGTASEPVNPTMVGLMRSSFKRQGVLGLGKALTAKSPEISLAQTQNPSFPKFVTLGYIQGILETEVMPVLDKVSAAAQRLEARQTLAFDLVIPDGDNRDTFSISKAEIYAFDAMCKLTTAYLGMYCAYEANLYAPGTQDYSWFDSLYYGSNSYSSQRTIWLSGDTLFDVWSSGGMSQSVYMAKMYKYNMERPGFMTIRKQNHARIKADLLAVASLVKKGVEAARTRTGDQHNAIIRLADITNADNDLVGFQDDLKRSGVSDTFAAHFKTPETIADFVTRLLSGPYTFNETIDSVAVSITVNFASLFDSPVQDLRTLLPKYQWTSENTWLVKSESNRYVDSWGSSSIYTYSSDSVVMRIPSSAFDSVRTETYGKTYYLKTPYTYKVRIDSSTYLDPLRLLDPQGKVLDGPAIDSLVDAKVFFPVFDDYTFHGFFPGMTRQKWIDLIYPN